MFWKKKARGVVSVNPGKCNGCGKCVKMCRRHVLELVTAENGKQAMTRHVNRCTGCGRCIVTCPQRTIEIIY